MNERVFANEFHNGFLQEADFLAFLTQREENSVCIKDAAIMLVLSNINFDINHSKAPLK